MTVFGNATVSTNSLLVTRAVIGDGNLDNVVNFADFVILSNNYGATNPRWSQGDYNGDGVVNFADFVQLSNNYGQTAANQLNLVV